MNERKASGMRDAYERHQDQLQADHCGRAGRFLLQQYSKSTNLAVSEWMEGRVVPSIGTNPT